MSDVERFPVDIGCQYAEGPGLLWRVDYIDDGVVLGLAQVVGDGSATDDSDYVAMRWLAEFESADAFDEWYRGLEMLLQSTGARAVDEAMAEVGRRMSRTREWKGAP